jgi:putative endonuclease
VPSAPARHARTSHRRALGRTGEDLAADHLARRGFAVLERNVRTRHGEIDLIAFDGATLVFVEVKAARAHSRDPRSRVATRPLEGLRTTQRARLRRLATAWLSDGTHPRPIARSLRFDAVGVTVDGRDRLIDLEHIEGAW